MKGRIFPIGDALHISMLDRIIVNVIDMVDIILFVSYRMFPKSALPYSALIFLYPTAGAVLVFRQLPGEC